MKKTALLVLALISLKTQAQTGLDNWIMNQGEFASYWENTAGQAGPPTYVFYTSTVLANVTKVCYNNTYVWTQSDGMTTNMGRFLNPGAPTEQNYTYRFPRVPTVPVTKTAVPMVGAIALLNNGVPAFGLSNAHYYNGTNNNGMGVGTWNVEVYLSEGFVLDTTMGAHPQQQGAYHSHANPTRLYEGTPATQHSPIIGYAFDGYPIYGPYGYVTATDASSGITRMKTGFALRNITTRTTLPDGTVLNSGQYGPAVSATYPLGTYVEDYAWSQANGGDLDIYNGRFCVTPEYPSGTYAYFITIDGNGTPEFPYILGTSYYGAPETADITMGANITIPSSGVTCFTEPLSVKEIQKMDAEVAPNPSNGIFNLKLPDVSGNVELEIYNTTGQLVYSTQFTGNEQIIDLSKESSGVFTLKVTNNGKVSYSKIALQ
ncbi:YHYH protein [Fluviicola sp.]|uniref:YHYH protein n=1 Tax=Fluviicola sp. TaxID=1917219 RepID=UPI0031D1BA00